MTARFVTKVTETQHLVLICDLCGQRETSVGLGIPVREPEQHFAAVTYTDYERRAAMGQLTLNTFMCCQTCAKKALIEFGVDAAAEFGKVNS